jgi:twitching motility protein PilT
MTDLSAIVSQSKSLLKSLREVIPPTLYSIEKQRFIGEKLIPKLPEDRKLLLRKLVNAFLLKMREMEASDIDFGGWGSNKQIWLRVHGDKKAIPQFGNYEQEETDILIQSLLMGSQICDLHEKRSIDFTYTLNGSNGDSARHRANAYYDLDALSLNMRAISTKIRPYSSFGFDPNVTKIFNLANTKEGLILITGITGSGKSTTLDAIVDLNNQVVNGHIIIIASPVEFVHKSKKCIVKHREVGTDTLSFKNGTIEALRQDPDIIMIGEMRDPDTIMAALEVADSGHKVFSTLHTSSAVESIDRIIGEMPSVEQERVKNRLADILRCVVSQKLIPSMDGKRVLAKEVMVMIPSIRAAIKNNNTTEIYQMIAEGTKYGMTTMEEDLRRLYLDRKISLESTFNYANNKRRMQQLLQKL